MTENMMDPLQATTPPEPPAPAARRRRRGSNLRLYARRYVRNWWAVAGLVIFILLVVIALVGPLVQKYRYDQMDFMAFSQGPSANHWLGTNQGGNDLFAMLVEGLRRSLLIAVLVSLGTTVIAAFVGAGAAYLGGRYEKVALFTVHFLMLVPTFLILAMISNHSGGDWKVITIILILTSWFLLARTIWTLSISLREREFIQAARYMGVRGFRVIVRHMLPNIGSLLIISFTLGVVVAVQAETSLSFLGFGVKIPDVSLGSLIGEGSAVVSSSPWMFYFPAGALTLLTVSMALIADGLRDALDPNSAAGGHA